MNKDLKRELNLVTTKLTSISDEIDRLLTSQQNLLRKRDELQQQIAKNSSSAWQHQQDFYKADHKWSAAMDKMRSSVFKLTSYRPLQLPTMNATMSRRDCILIMPTGGGKSLCYQLPSIISKGITLVISPLVSLMEDQLHALHSLGVNAALICASSTRETVNHIMKEMTNKDTSLKLLYVTPERIAKSKRFLAKLEKMHSLGLLARIAIDEVHCCSQWGHDFRPDYKKLGLLKRQFSDVPILGLTATATTKVVEDVKKILGIEDCVMFRASYNRPNLYYEVKTKPDTHEQVMEDISILIKRRFNQQSGIVYCLTRKDSELVTTELQRRGIRAGCYHADLSSHERTSVHTRWLDNELDVVVATIAFGMGIDKSNVRFVIHHSLSKSMENFYQESGRAGRDDEKSHCILYYRFADVFRQSVMAVMESTGQQNLYQMVAYCVDANRCRRQMIAMHFAESWDSMQCNGMCDHCDENCKVETSEFDITSHCNDIHKLLQNASSKGQRVTSLKLVDAWLGKGAPLLRLKSVNKPSLTRSQCEAVLMHLLLEGHVREDFHFTPYSTISYIIAAKPVLSRISVVLKVKSKDKDLASETTKGKPEKSPGTKPKLSFQKSGTSFKMNETSSIEIPEFGEGNSKRKNKMLGDKGSSSKRKRKKVEIKNNQESDWDSCDFDFGEWDAQESVNKADGHKNVGDSIDEFETLTWKKKLPLVISDSEDSNFDSSRKRIDTVRDCITIDSESE